MRAAVVDIGTNSTRLLIGEVSEDGKIEELVRRSRVTRLGAGVDTAGRLAPEACERVYAVLADYRAEIDAYAPGLSIAGDPTAPGDSGAGGLPDGYAPELPTAPEPSTPGDSGAGAAGGDYPNLAVMTSAVRDAANGRELADRIKYEYGLDAKILSGEEEAKMTFLGAMSGQPAGRSGKSGLRASVASAAAGRDAPGIAGPGVPGSAGPTVVIDIGGGSTEFIVGSNGEAGFHSSLPAGVVRMSERHIESDPPEPSELQALAADTRAVFLSGLPESERRAVTKGIAVAGTATAAAAIDQELDPYDPARVHGYRLLLATVEMLLARLADMDEARRREVIGLDPDRAPTIVAGMVLLSEAMRAFGLEEVEVSEHDILHGGLLTLARTASP
ncbi:MAG TPA: Ppx/GppA family phosphatase [Solirubrobacteraceae bacterium]|nr:Ppx/GppA family phosphatase [Solirubrobacteraceae bacterium]